MTNQPHPKLKKFLEAKEAHHLRLIFNQSLDGIQTDIILQRLFFRRIRKLLRNMDPFDKFHSKEALLNLQEDIEDEIETGRLFKAKTYNPHVNRDLTIGCNQFKPAPRDAILNEVIDKTIAEEKDFLAEDLNPSDDSLLKKMEKQLILKTLRECKNNRTMASRRLGISIRTMRNKLDQYLKEEEAAKAGGTHGQTYQ
jgi:DNA-binding protein Fis